MLCGALWYCKDVWREIKEEKSELKKKHNMYVKNWSVVTDGGKPAEIYSSERE
jgi:hypothetical protein